MLRPHPHRPVPTSSPNHAPTASEPLFDQLEPRLLLSGSALSLEMAWSTFLGGAGSDTGVSMATDVDGNLYVTGTVKEGDFPTTPGAFDDTRDGIRDVFLAKFRPNGALLWSTLFGGNDSDEPLDLDVDGSGNVYIKGPTYSSDLPTTPGVFDTSYNGGKDQFIAKFSSEGDFVWCTYLGGSQSEAMEWGKEGGLDVDAAGNVYVVGDTLSTDFPTTPGAYDTSANGDWDAYVAVLTTDGALVWSSYLGSAGIDSARGVAGKSINEVYLTGFTREASFPTTPGAYDTTYGGGLEDAYVARFGSGGTLEWSTFLGGASPEYGFDVMADSSGDLYVTGFTWSSDFPVTPSAHDTTHNGDQDSFVGKFSSDGSMVWSTFLGGSAWDAAYRLDLDSLQNVYVAGGTRSSDFPATPGAPDTTFNGGNMDADLAVLTPGGSLLWATYLGAGENDEPRDLTVDVRGNIYTGGRTSSSSFPTTPGAYNETYNGGQYDAFITKYGEPDEAPVVADDAYTTDEDEPLNVSAPGVLGNDTDADADPLTAVLVAGPDHAAAFQLNADGSFTYTPAADLNGSDSFTYVANDGVLDSAEATVTVTVNPVNDAPVVVNEIADVTVDEDAPDTVLDLSDVFDDVDMAGSGGETLITFDPGFGPSHEPVLYQGVTFDSLNPNNPIRADQDWDWAHPFDNIDGSSGGLALEYQYGKTDLRMDFSEPADRVSLLLSEAYVVSWTVTAFNEAGTSIGSIVATSPAPGDAALAELAFGDKIAAIVIVEPGWNSSNTLIDDLLLEGLPGDELTLSVAGNTNPALVTATLVGEVLTLAYVPDANSVEDPPPAEITIRATDLAGEWVEDEFTVTVNPVNDAPTLPGATFEIDENSPSATLVGTVMGTDPEDDPLTYHIVGGNELSAFAIDANTGEITVADATHLDYETTPSFTLLVVAQDDEEAASPEATVTIDLLNQASITGTVFVDVNEDGQFDANEPGIDGVVIELRDAEGAAILDEFGDPVTATTSDGGFYLFEDLAPDTYQLHEVQPTGIEDGEEILGSLGGTVVADDTMQLTLARVDASDYDFAEIGQQIASGDTATIGFWQNKHGQALIEAGGAALADWLTANFGNIFGDALVGSDSDVASFFKDQLFRQKSKKSAGPAKVDAQFMAVAFATYFTSSTLAGTVAADYGFNVTDTGIGTRIVNVGDSGAAFNVDDGTDLTIMQLLLATNFLTDLPDELSGFAHIYDQDGDGNIDSLEAWLRSLANEIYSAINEQGDS